MTCPSDKNEVTAAMNRRSSRRERGFTILEIVIVFVLLAGIMAFVGPRIFAKLGQAKSAEQRIRTQSLVGDIEMYKLEVGRYPDNLQALVKQPAGLDRWNGPYAKAEDLKDAWGNDYRYTFPGQSKPFDLLSLGADNKEGGEGEDRDVTN
jgi:general secretion pathway protein G